MKKLSTIIILKNGVSKTITVNVDDETARILQEQCDTKMIHNYILEEYKSRNSERRETRRHVSLEQLRNNGYELESKEKTPIEQCEREELIAGIHTAINKLTHDQQEVVRLFYFENKTQTEIAKIRGVHKTAVNKQLQRALNQIRKFLKNN